MTQGWLYQIQNGGMHRIFGCTQVTGRLVQHQVIGRFRTLNNLLINAHLAESADFEATFLADFAINANATGSKQKIGLAAANSILIA